jgi:hypothetical protein
VTYIIFENSDRTQMGLCAKDNWHQNDKDVYDNPMIVVRVFDAPNWDDANVVYENFMNS